MLVEILGSWFEDHFVNDVLDLAVFLAKSS
jgi:hypothetical protein